MFGALKKIKSSYLLIPLIIFIILGFFVLSNQNSIAVITIKWLIFSLSLFIIYQLLSKQIDTFDVDQFLMTQEDEADDDSQLTQKEISAINEDEINSLYSKEHHEKIVYTQKMSSERRFELFLDELLRILHSTFTAHSTLFFLADKKESLIVLKARKSESLLLKNQKKFRIDELGLVSSVIKKEQLISENDLSLGKSYLPYYRKEEAIRSFVGVPIFLNKMVIGVLALDSKSKNVFGYHERKVLLSYSDLFTHIISNLNELYDLESSAHIFSALYESTNDLRTNMNIPAIVDSIANISKKVLGFDHFTISFTQDNENGEVVFSIGNSNSITKGYKFRLNDGLVGGIMRNNRPINVTDLHRADKTLIPRFSNKESSDHPFRSFLGVPIGIGSGKKGVIGLEHVKPNYYSEQDQKILVTLANCATMAIERAVLFNRLQDKNTNGG